MAQWRFMIPNKSEDASVFSLCKRRPGNVRLIVYDRFVDNSPPTVTLVTAEGLSMLEVEVEEGLDPKSDEGKRALKLLGLSLDVGDIADAFRRFRISFPSIVFTLGSWTSPPKSWGS